MNEYFNALSPDFIFKLNYYFFILLLPIGLTGNILSFYICNTKKLTRTKLGFFIKLMAITNILKLLFMVFFQYSDIIFDYDLINYSDNWCKIIQYLRRIIRKLSPYIEILMTIDRFIALFYHKSRSFSITNSLFIKCFFGILVFFFIIDSPNLFTYKLDLSIKKCVPNPKTEFFNDISASIVRIFIPFTIMLSLNIILSRKIFKTKSKITSKKIRANFTINVISINFLFLILNLPLSIFFVYKLIYLGPKKYSNNSNSLETIFTICYGISTLYYASLFFINFLSNKLFYRATINKIKYFSFSRLINSNFKR